MGQAAVDGSLLPSPARHPALRARRKKLSLGKSRGCVTARLAGQGRAAGAECGQAGDGLNPSIPVEVACG